MVWIPATYYRPMMGSDTRSHWFNSLTVDSSVVCQAKRNPGIDIAMSCNGWWRRLARIDICFHLVNMGPLCYRNAIRSSISNAPLTHQHGGHTWSRHYLLQALALAKQPSIVSRSFHLLFSMQCPPTLLSLMVQIERIPSVLNTFASTFGSIWWLWPGYVDDGIQIRLYKFTDLPIQINPDSISSSVFIPSGQTQGLE